MIQNGRLVQTRWPGALCGALPSGEDAPAGLKTIGTVGRVKPFFDFVEGGVLQTTPVSAAREALRIYIVE